MWHPLEDKRWRRRTIIALYAGLCVACLIAGIFGTRVLAPAVTEKDVSRELAEGLADTLTENCKINLKYREQTRERAVINQKAQKFQVAANEALINVLNALPQVPEGAPGYDPEFQKAVSKLGHVLDQSNAKINELRASSTALLPLPDCTIYEDVVNDVLDETSS